MKIKDLIKEKQIITNKINNIVEDMETIDGIKLYINVSYNVDEMPQIRIMPSVFGEEETKIINGVIIHYAVSLNEHIDKVLERFKKYNLI